MPDSTVRSAYRAVNQRYIELFGSPADLAPDDTAFVLRHLTEATGPVLDLGCGPGHFTEVLHRAGVRATGIDLVPEFVDHARSRYPHLEFRVGSLRAIDRPNASVGGLLAWFSLIHFTPDELSGVLAELGRVLVPGGRLVLGFFDSDEREEKFEHKVTAAYRWPVARLSERLGAVGLTVAEYARRPGDGDVRPYAVLAAGREPE
ncbi:class I SAM-dependent methyltransferase [Nocardia rhizosphaerae]|uniref:Class I SAM-dependent methyltransferase n=1 Tax=Nocardia rhizosphaerae TaxID=1691571 RepID=A0ABV8L4C4_9NOCA